MRAQVVICVDEKGTIEVLTDGPGVDAFVVKASGVFSRTPEAPRYSPQDSDTARSFLGDRQVDSVVELIPVINAATVKRLVGAYDAHANGNGKRGCTN